MVKLFQLYEPHVFESTYRASVPPITSQYPYYSKRFHFTYTVRLLGS
jgi:hypothetical protein